VVETNNLSEQLFTRKRNVPETSALANSRAADTLRSHACHLLDGSQLESWYRLLRRALWAWQGADPISVEAILAKIAVNDHPRTNSALLDTVQGYQSGNWIYEWCQPGVAEQTRAKELEQEDPELACTGYQRAAHYFSIASYPHLRGDQLAEQAQLFGNVNYRNAVRLDGFTLKLLSVPFHGKNIQGYLHLPHTDEPLPLVIVSGSIDSLQIDFYGLFREYLAPRGIAMLTLDMPGIGYSSQWPLVEDTSRLHQAVLQYLEQVPWVDHRRVGMIGSRLAGNVVARLAFLEPYRLRGVVCIGGGVNRVFTDRERFDCLPQMLLDSLASRLGIDAADHELLRAQCMNLSLQRQGLLGRGPTSVPLLSIGHRDDLICPQEDLELLANSSRNGELQVFRQEAVIDIYQLALKQAVSWLQKHL